MATISWKKDHQFWIKEIVNYARFSFVETENCPCSKKNPTDLIFPVLVNKHGYMKHMKQWILHPTQKTLSQMLTETSFNEL